MLRKGKPASFGLFPVGSYVVVYSAGSFLPTLVGLLKAIRWCGCHHASRAVSTPSTKALASDALGAGTPLGLLGGSTWKPRRERLRRGFFISIRLMTLRCGKSHMLMPRAG